MSTKVFVFRGELKLDFIQVRPGDWVVIKPNFVKERNVAVDGEWESVVTSGAIIRQVCVYVAKQLAGRGRIVVCDAPQTDSSFRKIVDLVGLRQIAEDVLRDHRVPIEIVDLRGEEWDEVEEVIVARRKLAGDPEGAIAFNLGQHSLFYGYRGEGRYYGADYDANVTNRHHHGAIHEYLVCATPIKCDVFINLPKLKTHKKTGVTLNLKNLVGINADKNWLPHHTDGSPHDGGDQFPDISLRQTFERLAVGFARRLALTVPVAGPFLTRKLRKAGKAVFGTKGSTRSGNWYGNNTTWRMALDLNRCLLYGNPDGTLRSCAPKRYYSVIDGILGMEGDGPMAGSPIASRVTIGGTDPVATDLVAARVMGFDWRKLPIIREAFRLESLPVTSAKPEEIEVVSDVPEWNGRFFEIEARRFLNFRAHAGWAGHIEYESRR